jgi:hypothetical protein
MFVYYLKNCGLYFTTKENGVLVDGLFEQYGCFDGLPSETLTSILSCQSPFEHLSSLLFTHIHPDHYSKELIKQCTFTECTDFYTLLSFEIEHLPGPAFETPHKVLFLTIEDTTFFISGDANPAWCYRKFKDMNLPKVDYTFVNPYFLRITPGRRFLESLSPKKNYIYHLPSSPSNDEFGYYEMAREGLEKLNATELLRNPTNLPLLLLSTF